MCVRGGGGYVRCMCVCVCVCVCVRGGGRGVQNSDSNRRTFKTSGFSAANACHSSTL